jgi:hypothetical protein
MKLLIPLLLISVSSFAQKLTENKRDDFTNKGIKQTSVEKLARSSKMSGFSYDFSIRKVDSTYLFNVRMMSFGVYSIAKYDKFLIKLKNDSIITLYNPEYEISGRGRGSSGLSGSNTQGTSIYYPITVDQINQILQSDITKIRVYTTEGYSEEDVKESASDKVKAAFKLVL